MSLESYLETMQGCRGALETGFQHLDITVDKTTRQHDYDLDRRKTDRALPPPLDVKFPDLSFMNPPRRGKGTGRPRGSRNRPKYEAVNTVPQPGEIPLKVWMQQEAKRLGMVHAPSIYHFIRRGDYPNLKLRRVNARVIFVKI